MEAIDKVRILLINPMGNVLLMRIQDPSLTGPDVRPGESCWITIGGTIESGESIEEAARRETHEETGISDIEIAGQLEYREIELEIDGTPTMFRETYVAAKTNSWDHNSSGWTEQERRTVKDMRWWSLQDIRHTDELVLPPHLSQLMTAALAASEGPMSFTSSSREKPPHG